MSAPITAPTSVPWYASPRFRTLAVVAGILFVAAHAVVAVGFRDNDFTWHIGLGNAFLEHEPFTRGGDWYPLSRVMFDVLPAVMPYRLGRAVARLEAALSTPEMFGRVAIAQTLRDLTPDLMDILGTASSLPAGTDGAEYLFRLASPTGIYGGTLEVFRNMIAQHALGLGRPQYAPPRRV